VSDERLRLLEAMIASNPRWGSLRIPPPLDVGAEIGRLGADWIPLSFFWHSRDDDGETLTVFWTDRDHRPRHSERRWTTEELAELEDRRRRLRNLVQTFDAIVPLELAEKIVPVALWDDLGPSARLLVSPHGRLRGFPLHAIPVEGRPAILRWPVQYIPTLSLLTLPTRREHSEEVLLVGAPSTELHPTELPQVEAELSEIQRVWSRARPGHVARVIVGRDQTLADAGRPPETWSRADVLHLSCHGNFPVTRPFDAALLLGRDALRASELFATRLAASMVVLSACSLGEQVDTAEGSGGDEWIGMYLPLLYAGAQRMLVSLWEAEADPAQQFMVALHERLSTNALPDRAVSSACGELSSQPLSFWSNWYLVGTPERRS
jgi:CHAT domain-containing protein